MSYRRSQERNKRLKKLYYSSDWRGGVYFDNSKGRYIRTYRSSGAPVKWVKAYCNRKVRRSNHAGNHGKYRRIADFWWILY
jgi:hypothetical protein